jgi:hypothetical protein
MTFTHVKKSPLEVPFHELKNKDAKLPDDARELLSEIRQAANIF